MVNGFKLNDEEKIQALQLILERRRISQDLLKAHFGSSARAINILTSLETEGFISKLEGSERWKIHYDKIEKYLADKDITEEDEIPEYIDVREDNQKNERCYLKKLNREELEDVNGMIIVIIFIIILLLPVWGLLAMLYLYFTN